MDSQIIMDAIEQFKNANHNQEPLSFIIPVNDEETGASNGIRVEMRPEAIGALSRMSEAFDKSDRLIQHELPVSVRIPYINATPSPCLSPNIEQTFDAPEEYRNYAEESYVYMDFDGNFNIELIDARINGAKRGDLHFSMPAADFADTLSSIAQPDSKPAM